MNRRPANDSPVEGLPEVTEYIGVNEIQTGNTDLPAPEWTPTDVQPGMAPLPVYPEPGGVEARIDAMFDGVMEVARRIQRQMIADGLIRENVRTRCDDVEVSA